MYPSNDYAQGNAEARAQEGRQRYHRQKTSQHWYDENAWMHWEYSPEDWALFEKVDWQPVCLVFWGSISGLVASVIVPFLLGALFPDVPFLPVGVLGWFVCCVFGALYFDPYIDARKRHKARQREPRTVTFSRRGVWEAGTFFPIEKSSVYLRKVTLTFDPPVLHFRLREHSGKSSVSFKSLHVPVPRGQEEEAGFLHACFQTEVIQLREQMEKKWNSPPPEPR